MLKIIPLIIFAFVVSVFICSCATYPSNKSENLKEVKIGMTEEQVIGIFGEPNVISKTSEGTILWSYRPSWKIIPDNRGTLMIEFREGKVVKVVKVR
ncbi:MAG: outer membrane protein assembly factor BamE [Deltaproteobacteria bacterium]|nr:outer membrane protein assembly factor BamE [Deltaproteobacteria bacterium]